MFHLAAYTSTSSGAITDTALGMVADGALAQGSTGYRFTEPYRLLAAFARGAALTKAGFRSPSLNGLGLWTIYPLQLALNIASNPQVDDYRSFAPQVPLYEDFSAVVSDTQAAGEEIEVLAWLGTQNWTSDLSVLQGMASGNDPYVGRRMTLFSSTVVPKGAKAWGADTALTFDQIPRGGVYAVIGGVCVAAATLAWRLNFPKQPLYRGGRKLFPGDLTSQALGDAPNRFGPNWMGVWGIFHTWEMPFISIFGTAAANVTINLALQVVYLGGLNNPDQSLQNAAQMLANAA